MEFSVFDEVQKRCAQIAGEYSPFHSTYEGYATLLGEVRELEREVFEQPQSWSISKVRESSIRVAVMATKLVLDCCSGEEILPY